MTDNWLEDRNQVERLAYQYWEERGCQHGCHDDDWFRAEQEIRRRRAEPVPVQPNAAPDRTVVAVFHSMADARRAFDELHSKGFTPDEISFVANSAGAETPEPASPAGEVAADAGIGAALGGVGGLLLGFAGLAVPGVGPVLVAGPILGALGGAGVGAAAGGLIGALTADGVPEEDAGYYAEGVRRGDILITVRSSGERVDEAAEILNRCNPVNIRDRVSAWRKRGWSGHDIAGMPLTADELRREREYYVSAGQQGDEWASRTSAAKATGTARPQRERKTRGFRRG
jgi:hypothetical protein